MCFHLHSAETVAPASLRSRIAHPQLFVIHIDRYRNNDVEFSIAAAVFADLTFKTAVSSVHTHAAVVFVRHEHVPVAIGRQTPRTVEFAFFNNKISTTTQKDKNKPGLSPVEPNLLM